MTQGSAHQDMVDAFPFAFVFVAALCAVVARGLSGYVQQAMVFKIGHGLAVCGVVEVSRYDYPCIGGSVADGVNKFHGLLHNRHTPRKRLLFASELAWGMNHNDVERVARGKAA